MAKKSAHPNSKFFDYLSGKAGPEETRLIEEHLSTCDDCASAASLVGAIKSAVSAALAIKPFEQHPDVSELAYFFYGRSRKDVSSAVARHVALCASCAEDVAVYAAAATAADKYEPANAPRAEMPAQAWERIRDWEESSFSKPKPAGQLPPRELLDTLKRVLEERAELPTEVPRTAPGGETEVRVPVLVLSRSGEVNSVEYFEESVDASGARVLKHAEGSKRFDQRLVHMMMGGEEGSNVVSKLIKSDTLEFERAEGDEGLRRAYYFIIED